MKKGFLFILFIIPAILFSKNYLFINTSPLRASVFINGKDATLLTPCILKNDQVKNTVITVKKHGYKEYELTQKEIGSGDVEITLIPLSFDLYFPQKNSYQIGSARIKGPVYVTGLKPGKYQMDYDNDKMVFQKSNAFIPYEAGVGTALGLSFATMVALIALSEYNASQAYYTDNEVDYGYYTRTTQNLDIAKYIAIGTTASLTVAFSSVVAADLLSKNHNKKNEMEILNKTPSEQDEFLYQTAMQFTTSGEIDRSTKIMKTIITLYPESDLLPLVYYQLGQNYFIAGEYEQAKTYWDTFIRDYPTALYYDYVLKNLADIYVLSGDLDNGRMILERTVFTDNILTRESIASLKAKIDFERYKKSQDGTLYTKVEEEYEGLINNFPNSEKLDTYYLMLIQLYKITNAADKLSELKKTVAGRSDIDPVFKQLILSYF